MIGLGTGLGAVAFRDLIGFVRNPLFLGQFAMRYDADLFAPPSPWGPFVILVPVMASPWLLALLFLCKLLATTVSLGSAPSGGIFSASLFMGLTIGVAFASALVVLHVPLEINWPAFKMVGMAAIVDGCTDAAMTAVTMIFERRATKISCLQ